MPNHIYNVITFDCGHERAQQILEDLKCDGCDLGSIDFNKLIPMPDNVYKGPLGFKEREMYPGDLNWYDCYAYLHITVVMNSFPKCVVFRFF